MISTPNYQPNGMAAGPQDPERFAGIRRDYTAADVARLAGSFRIRYRLGRGFSVESSTGVNQAVDLIYVVEKD